MIETAAVLVIVESAQLAAALSPCVQNSAFLRPGNTGKTRRLNIAYTHKKYSSLTVTVEGSFLPRRCNADVYVHMDGSYRLVPRPRADGVAWGRGWSLWSTSRTSDIGHRLPSHRTSSTFTSDIVNRRIGHRQPLHRTSSHSATSRAIVYYNTVITGDSSEVYILTSPIFQARVLRLAHFCSV